MARQPYFDKNTEDIPEPESLILLHAISIASGSIMSIDSLNDLIVYLVLMSLVNKLQL